MQPNRLERCWPAMEAEILRRWEKLSQYDLRGVKGNFDGLVETIRRRYEPGRSKLSIEAEIRDWLVSRISKFENQKDSK
jgi:hypothetical protein